MPEMTSPQGEVLTIPPEGVQAMRALGWKVTTPARKKTEQTKTEQTEQTEKADEQTPPAKSVEARKQAARKTTRRKSRE